MRDGITVLDLMDDPTLLGRFFQGPSWDAWRVFLCALFALPMTAAQLETFQKHTGRTKPPIVPCSEVWLSKGRRGGGSIIGALISFYMSVFRDWRPFLGPGEVASGMVVTPDRRQTRVHRRFQRGFCQAIPAIESLLVSETKDGLEFANGVVLETQTASDKTLRGYTSHIIVNDEVAWLPCLDSAEPDYEILNAERPCLASLPGSLLLSISSPYARRGSLWDAYQQHYARENDPILFWKASSLEMNPSLDPRIVAAAYEADPAVADAEWGGNFRSDCERLFTSELLESITDNDRPEILPPCFEEVPA